MTTVPLKTNMELDLIRLIDGAAGAGNITRAQFIRDACSEKLGLKPPELMPPPE